MRILHVIPSLSPVHGGPSVALPLMARSLVRSGVAVDIATTDDDGAGRRLNEIPPGQRIERDGYGIYFFAKQTEFYKVSLPFRRWVYENARRYDVIHIHALFSFTSNSAARAARWLGIPYVVRPLGVLNRWGIRNRRRLLKSLSFRFLERPVLQHASAIHYTSRAEREEAEMLGASAKGVVIPLGIDVEEFCSLPGPERFLERCPEARGRAIVLFLSRIDPKKGIDLLLPAFAIAKQGHPSAFLVIAGVGESSYVKSLQGRAKDLGIESDVLWPGHLADHDKLSAFAAATIYVLPSYSENFGIALVEALAVGLPCITTTGVAVSEEIRNADAGVVVEPDVAALSGALDRLLGDADLRGKFRERSQKLARDQFSSGAMADRLQVLYEQVVIKR